MSDPPHPLPGLAAGSLIAELVELADHYRHTGVRYHIAVVVEPAFGSRPLTVISNAPAAAPRALLTALLAGDSPRPLPTESDPDGRHAL